MQGVLHSALRTGMTNTNEIRLTPLKILDAQMSFCIQAAQDGKLVSNVQRGMYSIRQSDSITIIASYWRHYSQHGMVVPKILTAKLTMALMPHVNQAKYY